MTVKAEKKRRVVLPIAKLRKVKGRWMGIKEARPDRQAIVDAIRADRESR